MIRILLVDDQKMIREALKVILESETDFQIVGTADNGITAIEQVAALKPDLVLMDIEMPGLDGANATKTITQKYSDTKVLILSSYDRDEYLAKAISVGAKGYLLKNADFQEVITAIRSVYQGYSQLSPGLLGKLSIQTSSSIVPSYDPALTTEKKVVSLVPSEEEATKTLVEIPQKSKLWQRLLLGMTFIGLGIAGIFIGSIALNYRLSNLVVKNGTINGRVVSLRSPIDGKLEEFYPRPGVFVEANQILAKIQSTSEPNDAIPRLQAEIQSKSSQILSAKQLLQFLQSNLQQQNSQSDRLWQVETKIDHGEVKQQEAAVEKAKVQAQLAQLDYQRFDKLQQQGASSQQQVDQARATWEVALAEQKEATEKLRSAQIALNASRQQLAANRNPSLSNNLARETAQLKQQIVDKSLEINNLETELALAKQQLAQIELDTSIARQLEIKAPLAAVVYRTAREQGELIQQSEPLLTLLDCNDIWVETVIKAENASKIDFDKPVLVELAGEAEPIKGQIALIQAVSSQGEQERSQRLQSQALVPTISRDLIGHNLSRLMVNIPPPSNHTQRNKFCGLGQPSTMTFATHHEVGLPKFLVDHWQQLKKFSFFARQP
ncbi:MAG: response regulator [Pleurocapsa sp.]